MFCYHDSLLTSDPSTKSHVKIRFLFRLTYDVRSFILEVLSFCLCTVIYVTRTMMLCDGDISLNGVGSSIKTSLNLGLGL